MCACLIWVGDIEPLSFSDLSRALILASLWLKVDYGSVRLFNFAIRDDPAVSCPSALGLATLGSSCLGSSLGSASATADRGLYKASNTLFLNVSARLYKFWSSKSPNCRFFFCKSWSNSSSLWFSCCIWDRLRHSSSMDLRCDSFSMLFWLRRWTNFWFLRVVSWFSYVCWSLSCRSLSFYLSKLVFKSYSAFSNCCISRSRILIMSKWFSFSAFIILNWPSSFKMSCFWAVIVYSLLWAFNFDSFYSKRIFCI